MGERLHIAIILDGNRRHARAEGKKPWEGHRDGAKALERITKACRSLPVRMLTLYTFSTENIHRSEKEKAALFELFRDYFSKWDRNEDTKGINVRFLGRLDLFPDDLQTMMQNIMDQTASNTDYTLNFMMGYGGRTEIVDAAKVLCSRGEAINEESLGAALYLSDEPDLIIRPGGEQRISNFLLWQGAYSEWYFSAKLWPRWTGTDLKKAIEDFAQRERRVGR